MHQRERSVYVFGCWLVSCCLLVGMRETVVNSMPFVIYWRREMKTGLSAAMHTCGQAAWPFLPAIVCLPKLIHLCLKPALMLDGFFSMLSVVMFIAIVKEMGGEGRLVASRCHLLRMNSIAYGNSRSWLLGVLSDFRFLSYPLFSPTTFITRFSLVYQLRCRNLIPH